LFCKAVNITFSQLVLKMLFGSAKTQPARVLTDKVLPLPTFDNTVLLTTFVLHSMIVFDTPLDAQKLSSSLSALVQREGWQKLSARLRKSVRASYSCRSASLGELIWKHIAR
jgi:hypothetical protein